MQDTHTHTQEAESQGDAVRPLTAEELLKVAGGPIIENDTERLGPG